MDYRPVPANHHEAYDRILRYAFHPESGPGWDTEEGPDRPDIFHPRGLYEATSDTPANDLSPSDLVAVGAYYAFTLRLRGEPFPVGGIAAVASPPETRRRGNVRHLLEGLHHELRSKGTALAALWPFDYGFYRQFGYELVNRQAVIELPPDEIRAIASDSGGMFRQADPDEWPALAEVYAGWADEDLAMKRTEGFWRHNIFSGFDQKPYVYLWRGPEDLPRAYIVYTIRETEDDRIVSVNELAYTDPEARRQAFRFLYNHDSQVETVRIRAPSEFPLLETVGNPRAADVKLRPGPMLRVVDTEAALSSLDFRSNGAVVLSITDEHLPWNDGRFHLTVEDGVGRCRPTDADADVSCGIETLAQLASGFRTAAQLETTNDLSVHSPDGLRTLQRLFPKRRTYLREGF